MSGVTRPGSSLQKIFFSQDGYLLANNEDNPDFWLHFYAEIDVVFENSGGPILNSRGEVVAIVGSVAAERSSAGAYASSIVIGVDMKKLISWLSELSQLGSHRMGR